MSVMALQISVQIAKQHAGPVASVACLHAPYSTDVRAIKNPSLSALKRGTGGRSSFNGIVATVFGATGFVGRYVCNRLGKIGTQLVLPYRGDPYDILRLRLVGDLGQVLFQPYDLRDEQSIRKAVKYSNVVINLVGRDWETKNFKFEDVHVTGAKAIARACREAGVDKLIHVSSLSAVANPEPLLLKNGSKWLASKYRGESAVRAEFPDAIIIRPAVIYGQEDRFLRYYAHIWRRQMHWLPLWKKGEVTEKQPVFVSDVAAAIVQAVRDPDAKGKVFQAIGPKRYKLSELVDWFHRVMRKDPKTWGYIRYDMRYDPLFRARISLTELISPSWPIGYLHWEGVEKEHLSDVVCEGVPTLEDLGITLTHMEDQVPWELRPFRAAAYYDEELGEFEKPAPPIALSV